MTSTEPAATDPQRTWVVVSGLKGLSHQAAGIALQQAQLQDLGVPLSITSTGFWFTSIDRDRWHQLSCGMEAITIPTASGAAIHVSTRLPNGTPVRPNAYRPPVSSNPPAKRPRIEPAAATASASSTTLSPLEPPSWPQVTVPLQLLLQHAGAPQHPSWPMAPPPAFPPHGTPATTQADICPKFVQYSSFAKLLPRTKVFNR